MASQQNQQQQPSQLQQQQQYNPQYMAPQSDTPYNDFKTTTEATQLPYDLNEYVRTFSGDGSQSSFDASANNMLLSETQSSDMGSTECIPQQTPNFDIPSTAEGSSIFTADKPSVDVPQNPIESPTRTFSPDMSLLQSSSDANCYIVDSEHVEQQPLYFTASMSDSNLKIQNKIINQPMHGQYRVYSEQQPQAMTTNASKGKPQNGPPKKRSYPRTPVTSTVNVTETPTATQPTPQQQQQSVTMKQSKKPRKTPAKSRTVATEELVVSFDGATSDVTDIEPFSEDDSDNEQPTSDLTRNHQQAQKQATHKPSSECTTPAKGRNKRSMSPVVVGGVVVENAAPVLARTKKVYQNSRIITQIKWPLEDEDEAATVANQLPMNKKVTKMRARLRKTEKMLRIDEPTMYDEYMRLCMDLLTKYKAPDFNKPRSELNKSRYANYPYFANGIDSLINVFTTLREIKKNQREQIDRHLRLAVDTFQLPVAEMRPVLSKFVNWVDSRRLVLLPFVHTKQVQIQEYFKEPAYCRMLKFLEIVIIAGLGNMILTKKYIHSLNATKNATPTFTDYTVPLQRRNIPKYREFMIRVHVLDLLYFNTTGCEQPIDYFTYHNIHYLQQQAIHNRTIQCTVDQIFTEMVTHMNRFFLDFVDENRMPPSMTALMAQMIEIFRSQTNDEIYGTIYRQLEIETRPIESHSLSVVFRLARLDACRDEPGWENLYTNDPHLHRIYNYLRDPERCEWDFTIFTAFHTECRQNRQIPQPNRGLFKAASTRASITTAMTPTTTNTTTLSTTSSASESDKHNMNAGELVADDHRKKNKKVDTDAEGCDGDDDDDDDDDASSGFGSVAPTQGVPANFQKPWQSMNQLQSTVPEPEPQKPQKKPRQVVATKNRRSTAAAPKNGPVATSSDLGAATPVVGNAQTPKAMSTILPTTTTTTVTTSSSPALVGNTTNASLAATSAIKRCKMENQVKTAMSVDDGASVNNVELKKRKVAGKVPKKYTSKVKK